MEASKSNISRRTVPASTAFHLLPSSPASPTRLQEESSKYDGVHNRMQKSMPLLPSTDHSSSSALPYFTARELSRTSLGTCGSHRTVVYFISAPTTTRTHDDHNPLHAIRAHGRRCHPAGLSASTSACSTSCHSLNAALTPVGRACSGHGRRPSNTAEEGAAVTKRPPSPESASHPPPAAAATTRERHKQM